LKEEAPNNIQTYIEPKEVGPAPVPDKPLISLKKKNQRLL